MNVFGTPSSPICEDGTIQCLLAETGGEAGYVLPLIILAVVLVAAGVIFAVREWRA